MDSTGAPTLHENEPHRNDLAHRLNWLRAGVLGANDGIVSVAAIVVGVAGVTTDSGPILIAGAAGVVGGAISMALGEYVSVSSQKDSQQALIEKERRELLEQPEEELEELAAIYQGKGLSADTARTVARELTEHDALGAHLSAELNIDETDIVSPWHAAFASAVAFLAGADPAHAGHPAAAGEHPGPADVRGRPRGPGRHRGAGRLDWRRFAAGRPRSGWWSAAPWRWLRRSSSATCSARAASYADTRRRLSGPRVPPRPQQLRWIR